LGGGGEIVPIGTPVEPLAKQRDFDAALSY
jgi:hypothetical protein